MYKYRNTVTGAEFTSKTKCAGADWQLVEDKKAEPVVKKQTVKRGVKK